MVARASAEKSQILSAFFPYVTEDDDKQGVSVSPGKALHMLRSESLFMAWLFSATKKLSRRFLKRLDPLFFREITHGASM